MELERQENILIIGHQVRLHVSHATPNPGLIRLLIRLSSVACGSPFTCQVQNRQLTERIYQIRVLPQPPAR